MKINYFSAIISAIVAIIIFCVIAVIFNVVPLDSLPISFIGATLGALIGALITLVLLRGQTDIEEKKGKDIRILEKKTEVFHDYIKEVWKVWEDQKITIEEFQILTSKYYQNLMIYLKRQKNEKRDVRLYKIGKYLSEIGKRIGKSSAEDIKELRKYIVRIINELSDELELGGKVSLKIMDEHDRIIFPLLFKNMILEALNKELPTDTVLEKGKFEYFKEGKDNLEYLIFNFRDYTGCKMILGPFCGGKTKFAFVIDSKYHKVDAFRAKNPYNQRIDMGDIVIGDHITNPVIGIEFNETDKENISSINFLDEDIMEKFRTEKREFPDILAKRAAYYFEAMKYKNDISILEMLEKYIKE